jgi:hypothetical protein
VSAVFSLELHVKDLPLLNAIQNFFGGIGFIIINKKKTISGIPSNKNTGPLRPKIYLDPI